MKSFFRAGGAGVAAKVVLTVTMLAIAGFVAAQAYVRWAINQDFTFLGGFELEALTLGAFTLLISFLFLHHREK